MASHTIKAGKRVHRHNSLEEVSCNPHAKSLMTPCKRTSAWYVLNSRNMSPQWSVQLNGKNIGNYIRTRRRKAGLSQRELGRLLGYADDGAVSRHEQSKTVPPLPIAIAYEIIFLNHVSELYTPVTEKMKTTIEQRLVEFEKDLKERTSKGGHARHIDHKLALLSERRNSRYS